MKLTKTKMCKFNTQGVCTRGADCLFAHSTKELNPLPDLRNTKFCKDLIQTGVCGDPFCTFAHNREELRAVPAGKPRACQFFADAGHCKLGARCRFSHDPDAIRSLRGGSPPPPPPSPPRGGHPEADGPPRSQRVPPDSRGLLRFPPGLMDGMGSVSPVPGGGVEKLRPAPGLMRGLSRANPIPSSHFMDKPAYVPMPAASGPWVGDWPHMMVARVASDGGTHTPPSSSGHSSDTTQSGRSSLVEWEDLSLQLQELKAAVFGPEEGGAEERVMPAVWRGGAKDRPQRVHRPMSAYSSQSTMCSLTEPEEYLSF